MSNTTIEAILKISAKMGNLKALSTLTNELSRVNKQVDAVSSKTCSLAAASSSTRLGYWAGSRSLPKLSTRLART